MPCKSMRRVLIHNWGGNGAEYVGRNLTLYGDPDVKFGGLAVGGIRISHMRHIPKEVTMALTATKASRKPFTVQPLVIAPQISIDDYIADISAAPTIEGLQHKFKEAQTAFKNHADFYKVIECKDKRKTELTKGE